MKTMELFELYKYCIVRTSSLCFDVYLNVVCYAVDGC